MLKNLNTSSFGQSCRQNELIELALTHRFDSIDLDIRTFTNQVSSHGLNHAARFISSANIQIGTFELPVQWHADEATFKADLAKLNGIAESAAAVRATRCLTTVPAYSHDLPYHEKFEQLRERLSEITELLHQHNIRLGLDFLAARHHRNGHDEPFITTPDALLTLVKTVASPNLGICVDTWNWQIAGANFELLQSIEPQQIINVSFADIPKDADLATITEEQRLLPGTSGVPNCSALISLLRGKKYDGTLTVIGNPSTFSTRNQTGNIRQISHALQNLLNPVTEEVSKESLAEGEKELESVS